MPPIGSRCTFGPRAPRRAARTRCPSAGTVAVRWRFCTQFVPKAVQMRTAHADKRGAERRPFPVMRYLKTSEAAALLNVSPNTLRAWERRFGFPARSARLVVIACTRTGRSLPSAMRCSTGCRSRPPSHAHVKGSALTPTRWSARSTRSTRHAPTTRSRERSRCARSIARCRRSCSTRSTRSPAGTEPSPCSGRSPRAGATAGCAARSGSSRRGCSRAPRSCSATPRATSSTRTPPTCARSSCSRCAPAPRAGLSVRGVANMSEALAAHRPDGVDHRRRGDVGRRGRPLGVRGAARDRPAAGGVYRRGPQRTACARQALRCFRARQERQPAR